MSTVKRVSGEYTIQSIGASDPINLISPFVNIDGNLTVTGNAVLVGNINADKIFNGTTSIEIPVTGGNANVTVGGTSNVVVWATTGEYVTGLQSVTGNITASFFLGNGSALTGITASGGSNITNGTSNVVVAASSNVTVGVAGTAAVTTFATTGIFVPGLLPTLFSERLDSCCG